MKEDVIKKRILFLDDNPLRHFLMATRYKKDRVDHVWTVAQFRKALRTQQRYHTIFLDYDLDSLPIEEEVGRTPPLFVDVVSTKVQSISVKSDPYENGGFAAEAVVQFPKKYPDKVVIHSRNPQGALVMANIVKSVGIPIVLKPFRYGRQLW